MDYGQFQLASKSMDLIRYNSRANINQDLIRDIYTYAVLVVCVVFIVESTSFPKSIAGGK